MRPSRDFSRSGNTGIVDVTSPGQCRSNRNDIPFTTDDLGTGPRDLLGEPILHVEDIPLRTSTNITLEGHRYHPGDVVHRVHFVGSELFYDVIGSGTGPHPYENVTLGISLFYGGVATVVSQHGH